MTTPIDCGLHDHLELACVYAYEIRIHLRDGSGFTGKAVTTRTTRDKLETLVIEGEAGEVQVAMRDIASIDVLTPNAAFSSLTFYK